MQGKYFFPFFDGGVIFSDCWLICLGATSICAQGLLWALHTGITSGGAQKDAGDGIQIGRLQGGTLPVILSLWFLLFGLGATPCIAHNSVFSMPGSNQG